MTDSEILNPKLMAPTCSAVWEWYKTLAPRLKEAINVHCIQCEVGDIEDIIDEIEHHAVEIEYLCRT